MLKYRSLLFLIFFSLILAGCKDCGKLFTISDRFTFQSGSLIRNGNVPPQWLQSSGSLIIMASYFESADQQLEKGPFTIIYMPTELETFFNGFGKNVTPLNTQDTKDLIKAAGVKNTKPVQVAPPGVYAVPMECSKFTNQNACYVELQFDTRSNIYAETLANLDIYNVCISKDCKSTFHVETIEDYEKGPGYIANASTMLEFFGFVDQSGDVIHP